MTQGEILAAAAQEKNLAPRPRRVVQICVSASDTFDILYALADDGTMWGKMVGLDPWGQIPPIPQPETLPAQD